MSYDDGGFLRRETATEPEKLRLCAKCSEYAQPGRKYCERHSGQAGTSCQRGYDYAWQKCRKAFLDENPVCYDCGGTATQVHHIQRIAERPDLRLVFSNLMGLCGPCHSKRTRQGE